MSVSELCREFGVSRPTGYRWINRYKESGPEGLLNLSSKPHSCSHATPETIENAILAMRGVNLRTLPILGFKNFESAVITIAGVELLRRIHKK